MATGSLINLRSISNKPGYTFNAGSIYNIFAEDYLPIKDALQTAGSEVLIKIVNLTTVERDNQVSTGSVTGSGIVVYNTTVGSLQFYDGTWHDLTDNYLVQGVLPIGSIPNLSGTYSVVSHNHNGSYLPMGVLPVGSIPALNYIPHGVLAIGSIPNLSSTYSLVTHAHNGSYLPQGILPVGSIPSLSSTYSVVTHAHTGSYLPQGILPVGSIPVLGYIPQGQLPTGSLPNTIIVSGSVIAGYGSFSGQLVSANLSGNNTGDQTLASLNGLPQGVLPVGSIPSLSGTYSLITHNHTGSYLPQGQLPTGSIPDLSVAYSLITHAHTGSYLPMGVLPVGSIPVLNYLPQGQLPTGSLPNTISITGSVIATYGSYTGNIIGGSYYGWVGTASGITTIALPQGQVPVGSLSAVLPQGVLPIGSLSNALPQGQLPTGSLPNHISVSGSITTSKIVSTGSIQGTYGSYSGNIIAGSYYGWVGTSGGITSAAIPHGVIAVGSIPSLTAYLPQGQLPTGSLPNNINISGSITTTKVVSTGSIQGMYGSFTGNVYSGSYFGYGGNLTGITATSAPSGSPTTIQFNDNGVGSGDSNLTWDKNEGILFTPAIITSAIEGVTAFGANILYTNSVELSNNEDTIYSVIQALPSAEDTAYGSALYINSTHNIVFGTINPYGSVLGSITSTGDFKILGSYYGDGSNLTGLPTGVTDHGALTGLTDDDHSQYLLVNGTRTGSNIIISGSMVATGSIKAGTGSFTAGVTAPFFIAKSGALYLENAGTAEIGNPLGSLSIVCDTIDFVKSDFVSRLGSFSPSGSLFTVGRVHSAGLISSGSATSTFVQSSGNIVSLGSYYGWVGTGGGITSVALPQGQLPTGSLPNNITVTGSIVSAYGSYTGNVVAGSYFGYGGALTGISAVGGGLTWSEVTGTSQSAIVDNGYIANNAGLVTITLPATSAVGKVVRVAGQGAGGWKIAQNAGQNVRFVSKTTTIGTGGSLVSTNRYDAVELLCVVANNTFNVISSVGNIGVG